MALLVSSHGRQTPYNNDVLLADAIAHGHLWVDRHDTTIDSLAYRGRNWIIEGPVPALLMVPFAAVWHEAANQTTEALVLCMIAMLAAYRLLRRRLGLSERKTLVLLAFMFAGTDLWWCSMLGDVWFISHTAAVAFTFLALGEAFGKKRGWLVAAWAVLAFGSRFSMVLALPLYGALLWMDASPEQRRQRLIDFGGVVALGFSLWIARDVTQYGTWRDLGYTLFYRQDPWGQPEGSPFRLAYLPYEIWSYFLQAPVLAEYRQLALWPIFKIDTRGIALTWTSPALVLAFVAPRSRLMWFLWGDGRSRRRAVVLVLPQRLGAVRHAPRAGFRAVHAGAHGAGAARARAHPAVGHGAGHLVVPGGHLGRLVLGHVRAHRQLSAGV